MMKLVSGFSNERGMCFTVLKKKKKKKHQLSTFQQTWQRLLKNDSNGKGKEVLTTKSGGGELVL